jgi:hypothetical protein
MQLIARHMVNIKWDANDNGDGRKMSADDIIDW